MKNMKNISKRALALFLTLVMCLGMVNVTVFADEVETTPEPAQLYTCGMDEHEHTDDCYKEQVVTKLVCEDEEHEHTDECYVPVVDPDKCGQQESEGHKHSEDCYGESKLTCEQEETEGHTHTDGCYTTETKTVEEKVLACELEESEDADGHKHTDGCYTTETKEVVEKTQVCELEESEGHTHSDGCYTKQLACEVEEDEGHKHTEACWKTEKVLTCKVEEHKHTEACKAVCSCETKCGDEPNAECPVCKDDPGKCEGKAAEEVSTMDEAELAEFTELVDALLADMMALQEKYGEGDEMPTQEEVDALKARFDELNAKRETVPGEAAEVLEKLDYLAEGFKTLDEMLAMLAANVSNLDQLKVALQAPNNKISVTSTIVISSNTELNLNGCTITYTGKAGSVFHVKSGTLTLNGTGTITGGRGTLIQKKDGKWYLGGQVTDEPKDSKGNGLNGYAAIIAGRQGVTCGGAILLTGTSQLVMNGGTIDNNTAAQGGGICAFRGAKVIIHGGSITNNTATAWAGGGMFLGAKDNLIDPTENKTNITIDNNCTETTGEGGDLGGGGIFLDSAGTLKIVNAVIHDNEAKGLGGGVAGCLHGMVSNLSPDTAAIYRNTAQKASTVGNLVDHDGYQYTDGSTNDDGSLKVKSDTLFSSWDTGLNGASAADYFVAGFSTIGSPSLGGGKAKWEGYAMARPASFTPPSGRTLVDYHAATPEIGCKAIKDMDPIAVQGLLGLHVTNISEVEVAATALDAPKVFITSNYSGQHGGGIGTNGLLTFGEQNYSYTSSTINLKATKTVTGGIGSDVTPVGYKFQLFNGTTLIGETTSVATNDPKIASITFNGLSTALLFGGGTVAGPKTATLTLKEVDPNKAGMTPAAARTITLNATRNGTVTTVTSHGGGNNVSAMLYTDTLNSATVSVGSATVSGNTVTLRGDANPTNEMHYGSLQVTKNVSGSTLASDASDTFTFTVDLSAPAGKTANWSTVTVAGDGVTDIQQGQATVKFTMGKDKTATISGIPADATYTVSEDNAGVKYEENPSIELEQGSDGKVSANETEKVTVTNARALMDVTVTKTVVVEANSKTKPADGTYTIRVPMGNSTTERIITGTTTAWLGEGTYVFELSVATPEVGQSNSVSATITGVPSNVTVGKPTETGLTGVFWKKTETSTDNSATVTNSYYEPQYTDVTVEKKFVGTFDAKYEPESVTVELLRNGQPFTQAGINTTAVLTKGQDNRWTAEWVGLLKHDPDNLNHPEFGYSVREVSVKYPAPVEGKGLEADARDGSIIRVRKAESIEVKGGKEIVGGWNVSESTDGYTTIITNTWRKATDIGEGSLTVVKRDSVDNDILIEGVEFTLTPAEGEAVTGETNNEGTYTFSGLKVGTYTLTETKVPAQYDVPANLSEKNESQKWTVEVTRTLTKVEAVDEQPPQYEEDIVGKNYWEYKTDKENGTLTVTNTPLLGSLTIKKELRGAGNKFFDKRDFEGKEFKFEVKDANGNVAMHVVEEKDADGKVTLKEVAVGENGVVTVKYGETITITGLRFGKYTVKEVTPNVNGDKYTWKGVMFAEVKDFEEPTTPGTGEDGGDKTEESVEGDKAKAAVLSNEPSESAPPTSVPSTSIGGIQWRPVPIDPDSIHWRPVPLDPATPTYGTDKSIEVEVKTNGQEIKVLAGNVYERKLANLTIGKTVVSETPLMEGEKFIFEVTLTNEHDGKPVNVDVSGNPNVTAKGDGKYEVTIEKSELDQSKHATATISGIPVGTKYTVTETSRDKWIVEGEPEGSQTLDNENGVEVKITNTRKTGSLTIKKIIEGLPNTDLYKEKTFAFAIDGPTEADGEFDAAYSDGTTGKVSFTGGKASVSFTGADIIAGKKSVTISKLPTGTYQVSEDDAEAQVSGYDLDVVIDNKNVEDKKDPNETTVTNNYKKKPTSSYTSLTVKKVWVGDDVETRPTVIKVQLLKDGKPSGDPVELKASNNWTKRWNNLSEGSKWSVEEVEVPEGYTSKVEKPKSGTTWTITNTYDTDIPDDPTPTSNMLSVNKVWLGDAGANRPDSVSVQIFKDGSLAETVTLNEANGWSWSKVLSEEELKSTWSVSEINVPEGYKSTVSGSGTSFTVTNSFGDTDIPEDPTPTTDVPDNPPPLVDWPDYPPPLVDWPLVEIPEDPVPMVPAEPEVDIPEDPTPMVGIPQTGDISLAWYAVAALSACGLAVLVLKKREDEEN